MQEELSCQSKKKERSCQVVVEFFVDNSNVFLTEQCVLCLPQAMNQCLRSAGSIKRHDWFLENTPVEAALHRFLQHPFCVFAVSLFSGLSVLILRSEIFTFQLAAVLDVHSCLAELSQAFFTPPNRISAEPL